METTPRDASAAGLPAPSGLVLTRIEPAEKPSRTARVVGTAGLWSNGTALFMALFLVGVLLSVLSYFGLGPLPVIAQWWRPLVELQPEGSAARAPKVEKPAMPLLQSEIDLVRVTSISLGRAPLAVVCGREVGVGEFFRLKTPRGIFPVRIEEIDEKGVRMWHEGEIIQAKLLPPVLPPRQPLTRP